MPKSEKGDSKKSSKPDGYFHWSREPSVGLFAVLPLWITYILLRSQLAPAERNGAELLLLEQFAPFGDYGYLILSVAFALMIGFAAFSLMKRGVPWLRVVAVIALEGVVYGVMLGPIAAAMTSSADQLLQASSIADDLAINLVGSIGAGIFEELVFRLGVMSVLVWLGARAVRSWGLPKFCAGLSAVVISALLFSWFHHLCGEEFNRGVFVFRTMAGVLLGLLMWARGYGVCVYTHTVYNLYFYLRP